MGGDLFSFYSKSTRGRFGGHAWDARLIAYSRSVQQYVGVSDGPREDSGVEEQKGGGTPPESCTAMFQFSRASIHERFVMAATTGDDSAIVGVKKG